MDRNHSQLHFLCFLFFFCFSCSVCIPVTGQTRILSRGFEHKKLSLWVLIRACGISFFFREHRECEATKVLLGVWKVLLRAVITTANVPS